MSSLIREPLFHFLAIGALLFAADALLGDSDTDTSMRIEVSVENIDHLATLWQRKWLRPPTTQELQGLVDEYIREEVLYREAIALGLDRDDTIVRRRLAQKLEFLSEDLAALAPPDEDELQRWYGEHAQDYLEPERISFVQIYFSTDRRGAAARSDAEQAMLALTAVGDSPPESGRGLGDPSLLQFVYQLLSPSEVARHLGPAFADSIAGLAAGAWQGPIESSLGIHVVRIIERQAGRQPALAEIRDLLLRDLERDRRERANQRFFEQLRSRYQIDVDNSAFQAQSS